MSAFTEATLRTADQEVGPSAYGGLRTRLSKAAAAHRRRHDEEYGDDDDDDDEEEEKRSVDDDELFDELERELDQDDNRGAGVMGRLREERMEALKAQIEKEQAQRNAPKGSGQLTEPSSEKELMQILGDRGGDLGTGSGLPIVVHFYHKEFRRCDIMNDHLQIIAAQHPETLFLKISVLSSPFLVEKLGVKVLPCLVTFGRRAQVKDQIIGFEDLGNSDGFTTHTLEWRLAQAGALRERHSTNGTADKSIFGFGNNVSVTNNNEDDDLDWD